ncbi:MAG: hypothetical protein LBT50_01235 [Prevotellaceae bacterium]|jgi:hypothetical protein|nr:hypothetical protein [Prevotellaceae bacterium]
MVLNRFFYTIRVVAIIIIAGCFVVGCSQEDSYYEAEKNISANEQEMLNIVRKYVTLEKNQYVISLSEKDAVQLGVSDDYYVRALDAIEKTNATIIEGLEREKTDPNFRIVFAGRQKSQEIGINRIRLKTGGESDDTWTSCGSFSFNYNLNSFPFFFTFGIPKKTEKVEFTLTSSSSSASVLLQINKKGNGLGNVSYSQQDNVNVTLIYNAYYPSSPVAEVTPSSNKAATWDIDVTAQSGSGTVNIAYFK